MWLIDANKILEKKTVPLGLRCEVVSVNEIENAPTIDPESLRPKGRWIMHDDKILGLSCECSVCHIETCGDSPYCPHCGAKMEG